MGFLSDLATLLNAGLSVADIKELAKINSTSQITPAPNDPAPDPSPEAQPDTKSAEQPEQANSETQTQAETAILSEISKLTSAIQAANILNSAKTEMPKAETADDILSANIRRMGGGANA